MKRLINKVTARMLSTTPVGDVGPFRGCFYPEELRFAVPTRAVAKAITDCIIKTKMQLAVFSAEPTESTETLHPWGWGAVVLTTMGVPIADNERIPHEIDDHDARGAWAAALVASAKAGGSPARCVSLHSPNRGIVPLSHALRACVPSQPPSPHSCLSTLV